MGLEFGGKTSPWRAGYPTQANRRLDPDFLYTYPFDGSVGGFLYGKPHEGRASSLSFTGNPGEWATQLLVVGRMLWGRLE
jgi:hypothetical protein